MTVTEVPSLDKKLFCYQLGGKLEIPKNEAQIWVTKTVLMSVLVNTVRAELSLQSS